MLFIAFSIYFAVCFLYNIFNALVLNNKILEDSEKAEDICGNIYIVMSVILGIFSIVMIIYTALNKSEFYNVYKEDIIVISILSILIIIGSFICISEGEDILAIFLYCIVLCLILLAIFVNNTVSYEEDLVKVEQPICISQESDKYIQISKEDNSNKVHIIYETAENKEKLKSIITDKNSVKIKQSDETYIFEYNKCPIKMNILGKKYTDYDKYTKKYTISVKSFDNIENIEVLLN